MWSFYGILLFSLGSMCLRHAGKGCCFTRFSSRQNMKGSLKPFLVRWLVCSIVETLNEVEVVLLIICTWKNNRCPWI